MGITKSQCRFPVFAYLSGQSHKVSMKLETKCSLTSFLETFEIDRKMERYIKNGIMEIHTHTLSVCVLLLIQIYLRISAASPYSNFHFN